MDYRDVNCSRVDERVCTEREDGENRRRNGYCGLLREGMVVTRAQSPDERVVIEFHVVGLARLEYVPRADWPIVLRDVVVYAGQSSPKASEKAFSTPPRMHSEA